MGNIFCPAESATQLPADHVHSNIYNWVEGGDFRREQSEMSPKRTTTIALGTIITGSVVLLLYGLLRYPTHFSDPDNIVRFYVAPAIVLLIGLALLVLPRSLKLSVITTIVTILLIEATFAFLDSWKAPNTTTGHDKRFQRPDGALGYAPIAGVTTRAWKKEDDRYVYDVTYSFGEHGERKTEIDDGPTRIKFAIFVGGSFTFGEGVNGNQNLPYYFSQYSPTHKPYNFGRPGYGPQQVLEFVARPDLYEAVDEQSGVLIYTLISSHIQRAIGSMVVYSHWGHGMPYYFLNDEDQLVRQSNFTAGRPVIAALYSLLGKSHVLSFFNIDVPIFVTEDHLRLTSRIIGEAKEVFSKRYANADFYVLVWPGAITVRDLIPHLEAQKVSYLNYFALFDYGQQEFQIKGDGHPTSKAYQAIARQLSQDLNTESVAESIYVRRFNPN